MATATLTTPPATITPDPASSLYRMSYDLYARIVELGLLGPKDRVVLLDGLLVNRMPKSSQHRNAVLRGQAAFKATIPAGWDVWAEQSIALRGGPDGDSAPEPDLTVVFGTLERYEDRDPIGSEIAMVVEVAANPEAVRVDRLALARYAFANIPIACIVNIPDRVLEVYSDPSGPAPKPGYRTSTILRPDQSFAREIGNPTTGPAALAPIRVSAFFAPI